MIWEIAKKEFLEKILDSRVTICFLIATALAILAVFVASQEYRTQKTAYDRATANSQANLKEVKVFSQFKPDVVFPPGPLSVFCRGIDLPSPMVVNVRVDWVPRYEQVVAGSNPLMRMFDTLDIATVFRILFALLVVLITYDSFSGEKESGTFRLVFSNPVWRSQILYGKIIGSLLVVLAVAVVTFSMAILLMEVLTGISLAAHHYARLLMILLITSLYLSTFAVFGTCTSIWFQHSSTSLAVSLLIWLVIGILQPNINKYVVAEFGYTPRLDDIEPALERARSSYLKELEQFQAQNGNVLTDKSKPKFLEGQMRIGPVTMYPAVADADYEILEYLIEQVQIYRKSGESAEAEWNLYNTLYLAHLESQLRWKRTLDLLSLAALFIHSTAILSGTDIDNIEGFLQQAREYRQQYLAYLEQKGIFSTNAQLFFSRLRRDQINRDATVQRLAQYAKDPTTIPWSQNQPPLDLRDAPVFGARERTTASDWEKAGRTAVPIIVYIGLLVIVAGRRFRIYDAR